MAGQLTSINEVIPVLYAEVRRREVTLAAVFVVIALLGLLLGFLWPKSFSASTTILVQESGIIQPLLEGRAVATGNADRAGIARQVIFSRKIMNEILETGGWMAKNPSPIDQDRLVEQIEDRTNITAPRDNLIQIVYRDSDATRTFKVTQRFAELFISESLAAKERESREAYEFINSQVEDYHKKLTDAEENLKKYRSANADAQPGAGADVNSRISALRGQVEQARMDLMAQRSQEAAMVSQLSGESEVNSVQTPEGVIRAQLAELQTQLDRLLLQYTDEYPDVVRIRHQINDLKSQLDKEQQRVAAARDAGVSRALDQSAQFNPLYQQLRSRLAELRQTTAATQSRMDASESMLNQELERSRRVAASESALAELTRDYEVNRDIYQDLLKRRENARVSMNLDEEKRGLTFRIQDPAIMPLRPSGLRFMHFAIAALVLGIALPLGFVFGVTRYDPRIRSAMQLEQLGIPVLAAVPLYTTRSDRTRERMRLAMIVLLLFGVAAAYGLIYWLKLTLSSVH